ncbi:MAG: hypothetical protein AAF928_16950 [Myxococcota bacterium]
MRMGRWRGWRQWPRRFPPGRVAAGLWCAGATSWGLFYFGRVVHAHYPVGQWLFWRYALMWAACALYLGACLSAGHATVRGILRRPLPHVLEHVAVSFAVGMLWFGLAIFGFGIAGWLNAATFFAVPLLLFAGGAPTTWRYVRRLRRGLRRRPAVGPRTATATAIWLGAWALGVGSLGLIYFSILSPKNIAFDALWKHIALAQHYAAAGAIERFPEGWVPSTAPCLAPYLYTWCLLLPGQRFFVLAELCQHLEFFSFVVSLTGISALAGRLLPPPIPGRPARIAGAWAARFLFPGVFLYDANISGGADHLAAVFAAPIFLALLRFLPRLGWRHGVLLGVTIVGVIMVKYSAAFALMVFPVIAVAARAFWLMGRAGIDRLRRRGSSGRGELRWLVGPLATVATGVVLTAPLWLKNWIWHGDPLYPLLHQVFPSTPWDADATWLYEHSYTAQHWKPDRDLEGLKETIRALWSFSFEPNNWKRFHGKVPVFGSLFTLLVLAVPALGRRVRLWALLLAVHVGIFVWYWTHHQDRYLQVLLPWMAAATAALMAMAWRLGWLPRIGLGALVAFQLIWGSDVYFIPGHAMAKRPAVVSAKLMSSGYEGDREARYVVFGYQKIARVLPPDARVLLHEQHPHLGLQRPAVHDWVSWQAGLNYGALGSPAAIDAKYRAFGVTHLLWPPSKSRNYASLASDLLFWHYAHRHTEGAKKVSGRMIASMPAAPVTDEGFDDDVLYLGCRPERSGLQKVADLHRPSFGPGRFGFPEARVRTASDDLATLAAQAGFLVVHRQCKNRFKDLRAVMGQFDSKLTRKRFEIYLRKR